MFLKSTLLTVLLALLGYSLMNFGQGLQKLGWDIAFPQGGKKPLKGKGWTLWGIGLACTAISILILLYAVSIGKVTVVGAMAGSGLIALTLFSHFVIKEKIGRFEMIGVGLIILAGIMLGLFAEPPRDEVIRIPRLFIYFGAVCGGYVIAWIIARKRELMIGVVIGAFSGALKGFVPLFQKISDSDIGRNLSVVSANPDGWFAGQPQWLVNLAELFGNPYFVIWFVVTNTSMVVFQFAHKWEKAIRFIPAFSANFILIPVVGGVLCFEETLHPLQWVGVGIILVGVYFITFLAQKDHEISEMEI